MFVDQCQSKLLSKFKAIEDSLYSVGLIDYLMVHVYQEYDVHWFRFTCNVSSLSVQYTTLEVLTKTSWWFANWLIIIVN